MGEDEVCHWCGGDMIFDTDDWSIMKCKPCMINECNHKNLERDMVSWNSHYIDFKETCIDCGVFRPFRIIFSKVQGRGEWDSHDVPKSEIYQE